MSIATIRLSDNPAVATLVKLLDPSYRKRSIFLHTTDNVTLVQPYWDGGSRTTMHPASLGGQPLRTPLVNSLWPNRPAMAEYRLSPDTCVYTTGTFRGKRAYMNLYLLNTVAHRMGV